MPLVPIFKENKSPVEAVAEPGLQSTDSNPPVVNPVAVDDRDKAVPVVIVLAVMVEGALAAKPEVNVVKPEIVGVAVQEVGETVKPDPAIVVPYEALPKVTAAAIP